MARESVKAFANVRNGWMCAWCDVDNQYTYSGSGSFQVCRQHTYLECCDILEKAAMMATEHMDDGDGYNKRNGWHIGEISIYKLQGNHITMTVNHCRVLFSGNAAQALAIVKATRLASEKADKEYEKEMAKWPQ